MADHDPDFREHVEKLFLDAEFLNLLGVKIKDVGVGWCETVMDVTEKHSQQDGFVHAGVQATLADHTAGAAARSIVGARTRILTIEFKINYLRPATGERLRCRGTVLKPGRSIIVAESEIFTQDSDGEKLAAKATVTLAAIGD